ncbi:MAG: hypothetical protein U0271_24860 [Polyangiaceae bacterium]
MRIVRTVVCLALAIAAALTSLHAGFSTTPEEVAAPLHERLLEDWEAPRRLGASREAELHKTNPEWVLMSRMFTALAFANDAAKDPPARARYVAAMDRIARTTIAELDGGGMNHFLLPYARRARFVDQRGRSLFVDGEIALMLAALELVDAGPDREVVAEVWVRRAREQIERGPALLGESYPDEAWMFCNAVALAAIRLHDVARGEPDAHAELFTRWVEHARAHLVDPGTGLLVSRLRYDGAAVEGPEGSTIWLVADMLLLVDEDFAREQYALARRALGRSLVGFAWSREWPASRPGSDDIDSGPTIPIVGANAGASGLAIVGAKAFDDEEFLDGLLTSLEFAGFPVDGRSRYAAGNLTADAVIAYGTRTGPLWALARARGGA